MTHELIHAFGKPQDDKDPPESRGWITDQDNTWNHNDCALDMGTTDRTTPQGNFNNAPTKLLDWAAYFEFDAARNLR